MQAADVHLEGLVRVALEFASGHDKLRANGTRALGNAGSSPRVVDSHPELMGSLVHTILLNGTHSALKVQWNACYALGKVLGVCGDSLQQQPWSGQVLESLVGSLSAATNFKVHFNSSITGDDHRDIYRSK